MEGAVTVVSLAKREEEVFVPWSPDPLELARDDRRAAAAERARRGPSLRGRLPSQQAGPGRPSSLLDQLPGIGEKRKKAIIKHFGSPERFLEASREEVEAVPGLPGKVAREVYAYVHKTG